MAFYDADGERLTTQEEAMAQEDPRCDGDIFKNGALAVSLPSLKTEACETWVNLVRVQCNEPIDWHFAGGNNHILTTGDIDKVRKAMQSQWLFLYEAFHHEHMKLGLGEMYDQNYVRRLLQMPPLPPTKPEPPKAPVAQRALTSFEKLLGRTMEETLSGKYLNLILADASKGDLYVDLPDPSTCEGLQITIKKMDHFSNRVIVDAGQHLIEGDITFILSEQFDTVVIFARGNSWWILSKFTQEPQ